ncbi:MAG: hypothetical protein AB7R89_01775 [Dehalococcoidia bacterium]
MIARVLEVSGLSTTSLSHVHEHTQSVKPPRALYVPFPFGTAFGRPHDAEQQHRVLRATLDLFAESSGPVLRNLAGESIEDEPPAAVQASAVPAEENHGDVAMEASRMRRYHEQWVAHTGRTGIGLTGIPPTKFRGVVRFLEAFADGREADMKERSDVPLPNWVRRCSDDLKALYYEARLAQRPEARGEELARWFWGETAAGQLLRRVRARLTASDDPGMRAAAAGISR